MFSFDVNATLNVMKRKLNKQKKTMDEMGAGQMDELCYLFR